MGKLLYSTCYATSKDGLKWEKPELNVVAGLPGLCLAGLLVYVSRKRIATHDSDVERTP